MEEINKAWSLTGTLTVLVKGAIRTFCETEEEKHEPHADLCSLKRYDHGFTGQWVSSWEPVLVRFSDGERWVPLSSVMSRSGLDVQYWHTKYGLIRLTVG